MDKKGLKYYDGMAIVDHFGLNNSMNVPAFFQLFVKPMPGINNTRVYVNWTSP